MKTKLGSGIIILLLMISLLSLSGCQNLDDGKPLSDKIESIEVDPNTLKQAEVLNEFDLSKITLIVNKVDGSFEEVQLDESMITKSDLTRLSSLGTHTFTIRYLGKQTTVTITLVETPLTVKLMSIHSLAKVSGLVTDTYEEWLASIKGSDGISIVTATVNDMGHLIVTLSNDETIDAGLVVGSKGDEVLLQVENGHIQWKYTNETTWNNLISLDDLKGTPGTNGKEVTFQVVDGVLQWQYVGETEWTSLIRLSTLIPIMVTFDPQGGILPVGYQSQVVIENGTTLDLPKPTKEGYEFAGWYSDLNHTNEINNSTIINSHMTLYAKWLVSQYNTTYYAHYESLNYLLSSSKENLDLAANFVDGLVENDNYGRVIPSLATGWTDETRDGKQVFRFDIRRGVKWVQRDGTEVAEVKAQDWISAAEYILNPRNNSEMIGIWFLHIEGAENYFCSLQVDQAPLGVTPECSSRLDYSYNNDVSQVGIKAIDDYTLEFTLVKPTPYFLSSLTSNAFFPVNKEYLQEQGFNFGFDGDRILYNGAYVMDMDAVDYEMSFVKNPKYWDAENVHINKVKMIYTPDYSNYDWSRIKYENGELSEFRVNENDVIGWQKYVSGNCYGEQCEGSLLNPIDPTAITLDTIDKYSYYNLWNFNRVNFDGSNKTAAEKIATQKAILNTDFRLGFFYGMNKGIYLEYYTPKNPLQWSRNTYSPRDLAVDQNGKDYIDFVAEVYAMKNNVTTERAKELLSDGSDGHFDEAKAQAFFANAKIELLNAGLSESDFPIKIEFVSSTNINLRNYQQAFVNDFNNRYGHIAQFKLNIPINGDEWTDWNNRKLSYDMRFIMGWGSDYADPTTFLNTYIVNGDMIAYSGLVDQASLQQQVLGTYTQMVQAGDIIYHPSKLDERFLKLAEAEYHLTYEQAIIIPFLSQSGKYVSISKIKPFTASKSSYGLAASKFKYRVLLENPVTRAEYEILRQEYETNR